MTDEQLKLLQTEIAYLRKEIETLISVRPVEIHYHYYYDLGKMKDLIDHFKQEFG